MAQRSLAVDYATRLLCVRVTDMSYARVGRRVLKADHGGPLPDKYPACAPEISADTRRKK